MKRIVLLASLLCFIPMLSAQGLDDLLPFLGSNQQDNSGDLMRVEQRVLDFEAELGDLANKLRDLQQEKERLEGQLRGFEIKGSGLGQLRRLEITGPGANEARDFLGRELWYDYVESEQQLRGSKANQRLKLTIVGRPSPQIEVTSDLFASIGWAGSRSLSMDNVAIRTNFDKVSTEAGTFWAAFSPLTLYYPTATSWFESELFSKRRDQWSKEQGIVGNKRRLEGFATHFTQDNLLLQGLMARVRDGSPHHRFITGLRAVLLPSTESQLSVQYVGFNDDHVSGSGPSINNEVLGFNWNAKVWKNLSFGGEYARSIYDDDLMTGLDAARDFALLGELNWKMDKVQLQGRSLNNGPYYFAPASQSRDYALADLSVFGPDFATTAMGGIVSEAINEALPFGLATPNRQGYQLRAFYIPTERIMAALERVSLSERSPASEFGQIASEFTTKRRFTMERLGCEFNLTGFLQLGGKRYPQRALIVLGQVEKRRTSRDDDAATTSDEKITLTSTIYDFGLSYQLEPGWKLMVGEKKNRSLSGDQESLHKTTLVGVEVAISSQTTAQLTYQIVDGTVAAGDWMGNLAELVFKANF